MCTQKPASFDKNLRYAKLKRSGISLGTHRYSRRTILFFFLNDKRDRLIRNKKKGLRTGEKCILRGVAGGGKKTVQTTCTKILLLSCGQTHFVTTLYVLSRYDNNILYYIVIYVCENIRYQLKYNLYKYLYVCVYA